MARGIFTLKQQLQGLQQRAWSGTMTTPAVEYLVVAGGGGGGYAGGGGGAGGLLQGSVPVTAGTSYTVTVGGGGAAASATDGSTGVSGQNSVLGSITASGGGGGGAYNGSSTTGQAGVSGGSGGGGGPRTSYSLIQGGQGTSGQGNSGGIGHLSGGQPYAGGGGGGAGTAGFTGGSSSQYDNIVNSGGAGIASAISGTVTTYAGGGSGSRAGGAYIVYGVGGVGGGGNQNASGGVNTGGGGGGNAAGGSGIVILSYPDIYAAPAATTGSPTVSTSGSGSLYFAGSDTGLILNSVNTYNNGTTNFTIEFWYYSNNSAGQQFDIIDGTGGNQYFTISMFANSGGAGTGLCYFYNGSAYVGSTAAVNVPTGVWTHFTIVRNGSTVTHYTNGVSQASTTNSYVLGNTSYNAVFGKQGNTSAASLVGYLSNFRYVNGTAIYTSSFTPPTTPLTAVTNTKILLNTVSGSPYADSSSNGYTSTTFTNLPTWNQSSPFATGLGYKNRVYTWTSSGSITF